MRESELPPRRRRLVLLIVWITLIWSSAIWAVIDKFRQFRLPVPIVSALFFGTVATASTVVMVRLYLAGEKQRRGE